MLALGVKPEGIPNVFMIDLPENELVERPDDPTIPFLLFDDAAERQLRSRGDFRAAFLMRKQRKHLYSVWLKALRRVKFQINDSRLRSRQYPFENTLRFEYSITRGLLLLRLAGFLHFAGICRCLDRPAVETVRRMTNLAAARS